VTALTRAGVTGIDDLAVLSRRELAAISGLGPGTIAAIRVVVPEPPTSVVRSGTSPDVGPADLAHPAIDPAAEAAEQESPDAPMIPSFDSLRASRRRTAVEVLVPGPLPAPSTAAPASGGVPSGGARGVPSGGAPRPADYADLLRLGVRVVGAVAGVPRRVARWAVREPVRCLGRLLGA
jgi:hypothetical protein